MLVGIGVNNGVFEGEGDEAGVAVKPGVPVGTTVTVGPGVNPIGGDVGTGPDVAVGPGKITVGVVPGPMGVGVGIPPGVGVAPGPEIVLCSVQASARAMTMQERDRTLALPGGMSRWGIGSPDGASRIGRHVLVFP